MTFDTQPKTVKHLELHVVRTCISFRSKDCLIQQYVLLDLLLRTFFPLCVFFVVAVVVIFFFRSTNLLDFPSVGISSLSSLCFLTKKAFKIP